METLKERRTGSTKKEEKGGKMDGVNSIHISEEAMNDTLSILQLKKNASQTKFSGVPTPEGPQGQVRQMHGLGRF